MRCIRCGSRNVALVNKSEGYSVTKGIAGQILFGPGGAVAGINGKQKSMYHCSMCGIDEVAAMPAVIERFINEAIEKNDIRSLRDYKKQYYNIEWNETPSTCGVVSSLNIANSAHQQLSFDNQRGNKDSNREKEKKDTSVANLANMIREYINDINAPVSDEDVYAKYEDYGKRSIIIAISDLKRKGKIKEAAPGIYVLVRDFDEMQRLMELEKELQEKKEIEKNEIINNSLLEYMHKASLLDGCLQGDAYNYVYFLDTKGTVHCLDSCVTLRYPEVIEVTKRKRSIIQQYGHDIKAFFIGNSYDGLFLGKDGTVHIEFNEMQKRDHPECIAYKQEIEQWEDIVFISENCNSFIGLKKDGTVVGTGENRNGQCNVSDWKNVVKIQLTGNCCYGLKEDGTILASGEIEQSQKLEIEKWRNIIDIAANGGAGLRNVNKIIGLHSDGTVSVCCKRIKQEEVSGWRDVIEVSAGPWGVVAIRSDGKAYFAGAHMEVNQWDGIIQLNMRGVYTSGLRYDGSVVVAPADCELGELTCDWSNIISIIDWNGGRTKSVCGAIFGIKKDGSVICTDPNLNKACAELKIYDDINKIEEERATADKEAVPRLEKQAIIRKENRAIAKELEERKKALSDIEKDYKSSVASLNREKNEVAVPADKDIRELNDKIWDMRKRFGSFGFFKKKERRELENALAEAENALEKAEKERERQKAELISSIDDKISTLRKNFEEQSKSLSEMISSLQEKCQK